MRKSATLLGWKRHTWFYQLTLKCFYAMTWRHTCLMMFMFIPIWQWVVNKINMRQRKSKCFEECNQETRIRVNKRNSHAQRPSTSIGDVVFYPLHSRLCEFFLSTKLKCLFVADFALFNYAFKICLIKSIHSKKTCIVLLFNQIQVCVCQNLQVIKFG